MNILETLIQLRDDLKDWVTINLNVLHSKIEEKTIPIDADLNSSSFNPVQNKTITKAINSLQDLVGSKPVSNQIFEAISNQEHFNGDYNALTNAPDITQGDLDNLVVVDNSGHIIFKINEEGIHGVNFISNNEIVATQPYVLELLDTSDSGVSAEYVHKSIESLQQNIESKIDGVGEDFVILDKNGHVVCRIDSGGIHTTSISVQGRNIIDSLESITPVKGIDYFTAEDKQNIVNDVIDALPLWEGGIY